ncbi:MAG: hypothetical protein H0U18_10230 [Pyrinomonadaceae bacterium]|nr:hypothetical protein [Pyrinomonadaceae bacterium]
MISHAAGADGPRRISPDGQSDRTRGRTNAVEPDGFRIGRQGGDSHKKTISLRSYSALAFHRDYQPRTDRLAHAEIAMGGATRRQDVGTVGNAAGFAEIANKLRLKLSGEGEQKLAKKYTTSNESYQLYLKDNFMHNARPLDGFGLERPLRLFLGIKMNFLICLLLSLTLLPPASAQSPVPIEKEPRHRLKFENQYVRVFDVFIPPNDTSLFHTHVNDGLSVRLADARIRDEALDGTPEDITVKRGAVSFALRPSPLTHRVSNIGITPFRNIFVEVLPSASMSPSAPPPELLAGHTLVLENERVRMSRLVLAPGQSAELHTHALRGLGVAVSEGRVAVISGGRRVRTVKFKPGDTQWHEGGTKYTLRNVDSTTFEAVEIELK